jgi:two-component system chemotaxis response regulator CheY
VIYYHSKLEKGVKSMPKKVLIVDDTAVVRKMIRSIYENEGWTVLEASGGNEAVEIYKRIKPDLVAMDISMVEGDGLTATAEIVKFDPNAKIIMISASSEKELVVKSIQAGAKGFIVKPIDTNRLLQETYKLVPPE